MKKKIIIIGGGISGLSAGIYALKNGFEAEIYEKYKVLGGECTAWERKNHTIDNCVSWLTGTSSKKKFYKIWEDLGVLGKDIDLVRHKSFLHVNDDKGNSVDLWADSERFINHLLKLSPEDKPLIIQLRKIIEAYKTMDIPCDKPFEEYSKWDILKLVFKFRKLGPIHGKFSKISIDEYAEQYKHPLIQKFIKSYLPRTYNVSSLFYIMGNFCCGNAYIPRGGSLGITKRMQDKFTALGGTWNSNKEATGIEAKEEHVQIVKFKDGTQAAGDYFVMTCDTNVTFNNIIGTAYMDTYFTDRYNKPKEYPLYSSLNTYFSVKDADLIKGISDTSWLETEENGVLLKTFSSELSYSPKGKALLQTLLIQYEEDFDYWEDLYTNNRSEYRAQKKQVALKMTAAIETKYPQLKKQLEIVEIVTPMSYHRFCGAYKGAYMSFIMSTLAPRKINDGRIKGLKNTYLAGQWLQPPGGLPNAAVTGKFVIQRICKAEKMESTK